MIEIRDESGAILAWDGRVIEAFGFTMDSTGAVRIHAREIISMELRDMRILGPVIEIKRVNGADWVVTQKFDAAAQAAFAEIAVEVQAARS